MVKYEVVIGSDTFVVEAKDNQEARYAAAKEFKTKYKLETSAADIASYASTKLVSGRVLTTKKLLKKLK